MAREIPLGIPQEVVLPEPKVEVIAETRKPRRGPRFRRIDSSVEGIRLVTEPGSDPHFNRRRTRSLKADGDRIARAKKYDAQAAKAKKRLIKAAEEQDGFRGVVSEKGNLETQVYPTTRRTYDPNLLEQSTGPYHGELVRESGRLIVDFPFVGEEGEKERFAHFAQIVARIMVEQGRDPEEVAMLVSPTIVQRLDEEKLNQLIADDKVSLIEGTRSEVVVWTAQVNPLDKRTDPNRQRPLGE